MEIRIASIYVWRGNAYVPTNGRVVGGGAFVAIDPVLQVELKKDQMIDAIKSTLSRGHPPLPDRSREEWDKLVSPVLVVTGAKSWNELYRTALIYTIEWGPKGVFLEFPLRAPKGGWVSDPEKRRQFSSDVDIEVIVEAILEDIAARPARKKKPTSKQT
jgi:hypothetical protein